MVKLLFLLCYLFFCLNFVQAGQSPEKFTYQNTQNWWQSKWEERDLQSFLGILEATKVGRRLVERALAKDKNFLQKISIGNASVTEANYVRNYSLDTVEEKIHMEEAIILSRHLSRLDAFYDFAHELTHFTEQVHLNPYSMEFNKVDFITMGIEGKGGELDAFQTECLLAIELRNKIPEHDLCKKYITQFTFSREAALRDFYAVGKNLERMMAWRSFFPHLNAQAATFYSSLEKMPYPLALLKDYTATIEMACKNNSRKAQLMAKHSASFVRNRQPQSQDLFRVEQIKLQQYFQKYCRETKTF